MRNLKKILAMALTVLMVVGSFAMTATAAFDDVTDYQEAIEVMAALGIAKGKSETEFAPDDDVTREEMALWITKIMTGKVEDNYVANNFLGAVENLTAFADLEEDNYVGAVNYAANNGIIVGTSATTFEPAEAIKIQDVFAMVVRMLGYGSTAMNNAYPWSFIDKAISLGLDADLAADYSVEAVASRGETMQILYNALTALKSDGSTLGYDFFGLEKATVVITGTAEGNMYSGAEVIKKTVDGEDYVSFAVLGANGNVSDATYYALKSAFGIEDDAELYVGNSYVVRTVDGFASFLTIEANGYEVVSQDSMTGAAKHGINDKCFFKAGDRYVDIDGASYKLVKAYSNFNGATKTNNDLEIIIVNGTGERKTVLDFDSYVMNKDLHILDENGDILLYWVTTHGVGNGLPEYANLNGMYLYKIYDDENGDPVYVQPNDYIWSLAAKASISGNGELGFSVLECSYDDIEEWDAYSDTKLYDDDNDGDYDRGIYYQYRFGKLDNTNDTVLGVTYPYIRANTVRVDTYNTGINNIDPNTEMKFIDADGNALSYADVKGKYVLYNYNPLYGTMIIKEIFEAQTGLVTGLDLAKKTMTFNGFGANIINGSVNGEVLEIGNEKLWGANFEEITKRNSLTSSKMLTETIGKNINYIEKDGKILAIYNAVNDGTHMVYVNNAPGYTTMGYQNILAYYDASASKIAATQSVVPVNAVNNYWYGTFNMPATGIVNYKLGDLLAATKDSLGNYDVSIVPAENGTYNKTAVIVADEEASININNGIVSSDIIGIDANDKEYTFTPFAVNANTVWIVWDNDTIDGFKTFKGIPTTGSSITVNDGGIVYYETSASGYENFIYVVDGEFADITFTQGSSYNPWNTTQNTTIILATNETKSNLVASNAYQYGYGVNHTMAYSYTKAIDVINGGYAPALMSDYNFGYMLEPGKYYLVKNGYVVGSADAYMADGILASADNDGSDTDTPWGYKLYTEVIDATGKTGKYELAEANDVSKKALPKVYVIESDGPFYSNWDEMNLRDILTDKDASASAKYTAQAAAYAAGYDKLNNADGVLDGTPVKYYAGGVDGLVFNVNAPVFIQQAGAAAVVIDIYDRDAAEEDAAKADLDAALKAAVVPVYVYGWDSDEVKSYDAFQYFYDTKDLIKVYTDKDLTEEVVMTDYGTTVGPQYPWYANATDVEIEATKTSVKLYIVAPKNIVGSSGEWTLNASYIVSNTNGFIADTPVSLGTPITSTSQGNMVVYEVTVDTSMVQGYDTMTAATATGATVHFVLSLDLAKAN